MKRLQRMPGASFERPRACKLTDIEPPSSSKQGPGGGSSLGAEDSANKMGSIARFPKLDECAHFHYEHVELGKLEVSISGVPEEQQQQLQQQQQTQPSATVSFAVRVTSGDACWTLQRTLDNLVMFDKQLHRCIFDRKFSMLAELSELAELTEPELQARGLEDYLRRFSSLNHEGLNCGPVLNWLQLDNRGRRILVPESDSCPINTPAVAAAYAVRPYQAQAQDELSFQVGDMISVIDMPPAGESSWWRGKHGFAVGFFPAECVAVIGDKLPRHLGLAGAARQPGLALAARPQAPVKPVLRKHGKLIAFFRSFILNRPSRRRLKQSGILRERVFGCDLGEHLLNSGHEVPTVLSCCAEFIERHGLVDGIYRLSGVSSNIQRLRHAFDEDRVPALHSDQSILQDIHSVASLLKMYFRELPNPLCTYQLYSSFVSAVQSASDSERLKRMRDAVRKLPPPHYRTLEYLMRHLVRVAARGEETGMTARNVAIVWAPNLLRCKELEVGGVAALQGVGVQAVVTEFLICYAELIFAAGPSEPADGPTPASPVSAGQRPKSLAIAGSSARLLSLEEARNRSLVQEPELIEVGAGPAGLPLHYHTVIELPQRKRNGSKRSPSLNWRALFGGRQSAKSRACSGEPEAARLETASATAPRRLRPVKSADSLDGLPAPGPGPGPGPGTGQGSGSEDGLGPLLGPGGPRPCGHSRSVSHDSYFEHLGDAPSANSALDLSEIQLSFELEEREMRMLEEEEGGRSRQSLEASPRRQRPGELASPPEPGSSGGPAQAGGSKRKRSRLEERLHCDVELRFIDSQSPDQVMVSADVHEMETPSPLPTPGYLPLLSEGSTPLTPTVSPRISFKSFVLPLDVGEQINVGRSSVGSIVGSVGNNNPAKDSIDKSSILESCLTKASRERDSSSSLNLDCSAGNLSINQNNAMEACEELLEASTERSTPLTPQHLAFISSPSEIVDQEMRPCERLLELDRASELTEATYHGLDVSPILPNVRHHDEEHQKNLDDSFNKNDAASKTSLGQVSSAQNSNIPDLSNMTDLDSLMPYVQSYEHSSDSSFIPADSRDQIPNESTTKTPNYGDDLQNTEKWLMTDSSSDSIESTNEMDENRLQRITHLKVTPNLELEECQSSCNTPKTCEESMCYVVTDEDYHIENPQPVNTNFNATCEEDGSNEGRSRDSKHIDQTELLNLVSLETDLHTPNSDLSTNQSSCENSICQVNTDINNCTNYQNNQITSQTSSWDLLLADTNECEINQNETDKSTSCQDQNNRFFDKGKCDVGQSAFILERKEQPVEKSVCVESKESQNNSSSTIGQISNCSNVCSPHNEYHSKRVNLESNNSSTIQTTRIEDDLEVVVPSESAAVEPQEMAHVPEMSSQSINLDSSCTFSLTNNTGLERDSIIPKDTATILQELALQRLSGGDRVDLIPTRRRYDSDIARDRRSFDSEIGREIVREHKMKQELENARGKLDESHVGSHNQTVPVAHLPPCLRARQARATRTTLSRSLDEAKFNKMTSGCSVGGVGGNSGTAEYLSRMKSNKSETSQQHSSTPDVGSKSSITQPGLSKNLGLDLDDPRCRERIEKYKEERRTFLRDKYRSESFRASASSAAGTDANSNKEDGEQALLARLKQRASRPSLL